MKAEETGRRTESAAAPVGFHRAFIFRLHPNPIPAITGARCAAGVPKGRLQALDVLVFSRPNLNLGTGSSRLGVSIPDAEAARGVSTAAFRFPRPSAA